MSSNENMNDINDDYKKKNKTKVKKVRFSDDPSENEIVIIMAYIPSLFEISPSTRKSIWLDKWEVSSIMKSARSTGKCASGNIEVSKYLSKAYDASLEYSKIRRKLGSPEFSYDDYHSRKSINHLRKWMRHQCAHRGLENYCSFYYESKREQDENRYRNAIFNEQRKQRKLSSSNKLSIEQNECIHQTAIKHSRVSVCFAYALGAADAIEAGIDIFPSKPGKMQKAFSVFKTKLFRKSADKNVSSNSNTLRATRSRTSVSSPAMAIERKPPRARRVSSVW